jgi:putative ABC transport system permease protein
MLTLGFQYAIREKMRFALTAAGVASAVVLTVFLAGVYRGAVRGSLSYVEQADAQVWVGRRGSWNLMRTSGLLPGSTQEALFKVEGVLGVESILAALLPARIDGQQRTLLVIGLESEARAAVPRLLAAGKACPGPGEVVVDAAFARRAGLDLGEGLELAGRNFRISGISRETNLLVTQYAFLQSRDLKEMLGLTHQASFLLVRTEPGQTQTVERLLNEQVPDISAYDAASFLANNRREIASGFLPVLWAIVALGIAVGATVVALTTYAAVLEKRTDYALLAALGGGQTTRSLVVLEQALVAALAGCALGLILLAVIEQALPWLVPEVEFHLDPLLGAAALLGSAIVAWGGALFPARLAARIPPMEAFKR